jgi:hypothetical protein
VLLLLDMRQSAAARLRQPTKVVQLRALSELWLSASQLTGQDLPSASTYHGQLAEYCGGGGAIPAVYAIRKKQTNAWHAGLVFGVHIRTMVFKVHPNICSRYTKK